MTTAQLVELGMSRQAHRKWNVARTLGDLLRFMHNGDHRPALGEALALDPPPVLLDRDTSWVAPTDEAKQVFQPEGRHDLQAVVRTQPYGNAGSGLRPRAYGVGRGSQRLRTRTSRPDRTAPSLIPSDGFGFRTRRSFEAYPVRLVRRSRGPRCTDSYRRRTRSSLR